MNFYNKHILNDFSFKKYEILTLFEISKKKIKNFLNNKNICILNDKKSLRTINSLINSFNYLNIKYLQILNNHNIKKESFKDFSRTIGLNFDYLYYRCLNDKILKIIAKYSSLIIVNLLSNGYHPIQALTDINSFFYNKKDVLMYIGNITSNVIRSIIILLSKINYLVVLISPIKYWFKFLIKKIFPKKKILISEKLILFKKKYYVYTDVWESMNNKNVKITDFLNLQINKKLFDLIKIKKVLHCMPRFNKSYLDFEISNLVFESDYFLVNNSIIKKNKIFKSYIFISNSFFFKII
ncbi:ornithine carbamoyltransferase [Candidatus Carsonella ruddii PV]|uniref:Ornithine transcarbamylase n=2 Tax=Carsonella ruddii TaxID=114186 RepID=Q9AHW8_CARRU|nr:ornithine carbamoyltransferase [Candidatus Carsonella ruddii]AAK17113.1 ornithine transcarbamylase [Candidatus Carsonella ruddii]BAF35042.1 ornithine carbamoyltransferase [Candidatus Carsonella ruddii PV]